MFIYNRKMWKTLYLLCILFFKSSISDLICCAFLEVFSLDKCTQDREYLQGISLSGVVVCEIRSSTYQKTFQNFRIETMHSNAKERERCYEELNSWESPNTSSSKLHELVASCLLHVNSLRINTYEHTKLSTLHAIPRLMPNITKLIWEMHNKCQSVNDFVAQFKQLKVITFDASRSVDLNECDNFSFNGATQLTELQININRLSVNSANSNRYVFNATFLANLKNLQRLKLNCESDIFEVDLPVEMFQGLANLNRLTLEHCSFNRLSAAHFQNLTNLWGLSLVYARFDDFDWLRSEILAKQIVFLRIKFISIKTSNNYFNNLSYLKNYYDIYILSVDPLYNLTSTNNWLSRSFCAYDQCELFVDKDGTKCPSECICSHSVEGIGLTIYCIDFEAVTQLEKLPKPYEGSTVMVLKNLNLTNLPNTTIDGYSNVQQLYVGNNQLDDLTISQLPENLVSLEISYNRLKFLRPEVIEFFEQRNDSLKINISENPWTCDCYEQNFLKFIERCKNMIVDFKDIRCDGMTPVQKLEKCRLRLIYLIIALALVSIAVCIIVFWFRTSILLWLYDHNIFVSCILRTAENIEFPQKFDAFLAYSHQNLDLVPEYVDRLEKGQREFKLCFYQRDWGIGESIPACILQSIEDSKRIIVLMTMQFLKSSWGTFEFRTAIRATSMNRSKRLIIIVYPEVENFNELDLELKLYMKYNTYLRRDDPQFWRKLIYGMPHKKLGKSKRNTKPNVEY